MTKTIINQEEKMRNIFETAQKMKNGTIKPAKVYDSIEDFATMQKRKLFLESNNRIKSESLVYTDFTECQK